MQSLTFAGPGTTVILPQGAQAIHAVTQTDVGLPPKTIVTLGTRTSVDVVPAVTAEGMPVILPVATKTGTIPLPTRPRKQAGTQTNRGADANATICVPPSSLKYKQ